MTDANTHRRRANRKTTAVFSWRSFLFFMGAARGPILYTIPRRTASEVLFSYYCISIFFFLYHRRDKADNQQIPSPRCSIIVFSVKASSLEENTFDSFKDSIDHINSAVFFFFSELLFIDCSVVGSCLLSLAP